MMLEKEAETYRRLKPELLGKGHQGRFAVIFGDELAGVWDTFGDACGAGYRRYHEVPFMVKEIQEVEPIYTITRLVAPTCLY
jgi:hypothetical protein